jgi:hypothetical protein
MSIGLKILTVLLLGIYGSFAAVPAQAQDYDVVILNGRVLDPETDFDAVRNVGIRDGSIVAITAKNIEGEKTIDATGHAVAPGYGRKEYFALAELAAARDVATFTHVRYASNMEPRSSFEAVQELIANAAITGAHMHLCHINSTSLKDIDATLKLVDAAFERDINISVGAYPEEPPARWSGQPCSRVRGGLSVAHRADRFSDRRRHPGGAGADLRHAGSQGGRARYPGENLE